MFNAKIAAAGAALLLAAPVAAQQAMDHSKMDHSKMMQNTAANPYAQSEMKMHSAMMKAMGADASETWVRKMIEHHRGAIDMSRIAMKQAADKEARDKAMKTATMQEKEIGELQSWLKRHGKRPQ